MIAHLIAAAYPVSVVNRLHALALDYRTLLGFNMRNAVPAADYGAAIALGRECVMPELEKLRTLLGEDFAPMWADALESARLRLAR